MVITIPLTSCFISVKVARRCKKCAAQDFELQKEKFYQYKIYMIILFLHSHRLKLSTNFDAGTIIKIPNCECYGAFLIT